MTERPPLSPEEMMLSYSKYYFLEPDPPHPLAKQALRQQLAEEDILKPEDVAKMLAPGYDSEAMLGYRIWDGASYSSLYAQLHGVTTDMLDWWFVWFCIPPASVPREAGNLRYKIWNPEDHFDHWPDDEVDGGWSRARLTDENLPMFWRRQGIYDASIEAIDVHGPAGYKTLHMHLDDYRALKVPQECWDYALSVGTVSVFHTDHSVQVQFYRNTDYGCEAIIRTWRGYTLAEDGTIVKVDGYPTPTKEHILADFEHNFVEIPHLAKFLPSLYAEEGHKPVTAY